PVAQRRADHRIGHAGVAAGRVDEDLFAREPAVGDGVADHLQRRPIFDRATGIAPFALAPQLDAGQAGLEASQAHERRVPDCLADGSDAAHHGMARLPEAGAPMPSSRLMASTASWAPARQASAGSAASGGAAMRSASALPARTTRTPAAARYS